MSLYILVSSAFSSLNVTLHISADILATLFQVQAEYLLYLVVYS